MNLTVSSLQPTEINLKGHAREQLSALLNSLLADLSDLTSMFQEAHWNVKGPAFFTLHKLFEEIYDTLDGQRDDLAERITTLGGFANGTTRRLASETTLTGLPTEVNGSMGYVETLIERTGAVANRYRNAVQQSSDLGDENSADLLTGISRSLDKSLWFLEAHMR